MSVNAFYNAFNNTQNALGDPRGDARKREQEDMLNAFKRREMQIKEYEFGQTQAEAQRAERERQLLAAREASRAGFIRDAMFPNRGPAQAQSQAFNDVQGQLSERPTMAMPMAASAPMTGGAPIEQAQGQAFVDPATGREGATYTATSARRGPMPTLEEILQFEAKDAYARGDYDYGNSRIELLRKNMTEEEKKGREMIALAARPIIKLPTHEARVRAVKQAMLSMGISADQTKIDDFFNDPEGLLLELELAEGMGAPDDKIKANIKVGETYDQFRPFEPRDLGNRVAAFDPRTGQFGSGPSIGLSPNTAATTSTQIRTAQIGANSRITAADLQRQGAVAMAAAGGKIELVPDDDLPDGE
jgi:hypothetical protein